MVKSDHVLHFVRLSACVIERVSAGCEAGDFTYRKSVEKPQIGLMSDNNVAL